MNRPFVRRALVLALTFVAARGALHLATFALPLSNDDAIPMIQAGLLLRGEATTTLINQPYNGTLDSWLMAPLLWMGGSHLVFRLYALVCAAALVLVCAGLAGKAGGPAASWAAGLMAAFGTPYMGLMAAVGPVPNFVIPVLVAIVLGRVWTTPAGVVHRVAGAGLLAGLAAWDSALA